MMGKYYCSTCKQSFAEEENLGTLLWHLQENLRNGGDYLDLSPDQKANSEAHLLYLKKKPVTDWLADDKNFFRVFLNYPQRHELIYHQSSP